MGSRRLVLAVAAMVAYPAFAQQGHVGAEACAACHVEQSRLHAGSAHALSLARPPDHSLSDKFSAVQSTQGIVADWAFGAGDQAVTFVSRLDEEWYLEHSQSYYRDGDRYDVTPGHQSLPIDDSDPVSGVRYRVFSSQSEILRCFRCHSTGPLSLGNQFQIEPSELGVRCESCHGPGASHVQAIAAGRTDDARTAIENPGRLAPAELVVRCGGCHRPPSSDPTDVDYQDPWNVRHQPVYLTQSRCFAESGALTCMNCHNPHDRVRRNEAGFYRERCLGCHSAETLPPASACGDTGTADCALCHMPKVRPHERLVFTNHWIGVFDGDGSLVPRR